jgi:glutamate/tyrosine decarboxylase-like PLP-dependent enzyme
MIEMNRQVFLDQFATNVEAVDEWYADEWDGYSPDVSSQVDPDQVAKIMRRLTKRLRKNYPYAHPRYAGQMIKPPHPVAILAYATTMLINPNNHALDGGPATSAMEREVIAELATMVGFASDHIGHLTGGGTVANLEALWVARSLHPDKAIVISDQAHYTQARACELLRASYLTIPSDASGRMDLDELGHVLNSGVVGTVVATAGTTGLGAVDPVHTMREMTRLAGARLHVDAAYGGFFSLLAQAERPILDPVPFRAIADADSVVIDPHKHGLQPYGCGAVLFGDATVSRFYAHDSPYTYFTSAEPHLGEISLECSRPGAAAAALWATLQALPLEPDRGIGSILKRCRQAALAWAELIEEDPRLNLVCQPDLDIVCFYACPDGVERPTASLLSAVSQRVFERAMEDPNDPFYLATLVVRKEQIAGSHPLVVWDQPTMTVLRSVLMKPEHAGWVPRLHAAVLRQVEA